MNDEIKQYMGALEKKAIPYRAALAINPFDLNAMQNLNKLDNMFIEGIQRYLTTNQYHNEQ